MEKRVVAVSPVAKFWNRYKKQIIAILLILALFLIGEIATGAFFSLEQILLTFKIAAIVALFGLAQMVVGAAGDSGLDLSVGYCATLAAIYAAKAMDGQASNLFVGILIALAIGILVGAINGVFVAYMRLPALVVTMAITSIIQGYINVYTTSNSITGKPAPILVDIAAKMTGIVPNITFLLVVVAIIAMFVIYKTKWGVKLLSVGANEKAAYLCGINVKRVRFTAYVVAGAISGLMGLVLLGNMNMAFKDMGSIYVMPSIAAVVVGGVSMNGGEGNYVGVILGAMALQTLTNLFYALGLGEAAKWAGIGLVLLIMLIAYVRDTRKR
ncbi:MAG: ABC transporter permease [Clostridia bacterium]|nr:ABC transporter permease [Clostridia bacterium]